MEERLAEQNSRVESDRILFIWNKVKRTEARIAGYCLYLCKISISPKSHSFLTPTLDK